MDPDLATEKEQATEKSERYCNKCDFTCHKMSSWLRHISTTKHNKNTPIDKKQSFICSCGKQYSDRSGLWRHTKICVSILDSDELKETEALEEKTPDLVQVLISENKELKLLILELIKKLHSQD